MLYIRTSRHTHTLVDQLLPYLTLLHYTTTIQNSHTESAPEAEAMTLSQNPLRMKTELKMPSPSCTRLCHPTATISLRPLMQSISATV